MTNALLHKDDVFTYLPLELSVSDLQLNEFASEVESVSEEHWFWSPYRSCWMLSLYTGGGDLRRFEISDHEKIFSWTQAAASMPQLQDFLTNHVFSWMQPPGRTVILKTLPHRSISLHTDCSYEDRDKSQYKFRIVLKGSRNNLWFLGDDRQKYFIDGRHSSYLIDGSHPHGMENEGPTEKLTLCVGAPWMNSPTPQFLDLIETSLQKNKLSTIFRNSIGRPVNKDFFQSCYAKF